MQPQVTSLTHAAPATANVEIAVELLVVPSIIAFQPAGGVHDVVTDVVIAASVVIVDRLAGAVVCQEEVAGDDIRQRRHIGRPIPAPLPDEGLPVPRVERA